VLVLDLPSVLVGILPVLHMDGGDNAVGGVASAVPFFKIHQRLDFARALQDAAALFLANRIGVAAVGVVGARL